MPQPMVTLEHVFKWYRSGFSKTNVLSDITTSVKEGQILGLLGPNGAGKTTLIKLLLGLTPLSKGEITLFGKREIERSSRERIGFLPEESYLYPFLTIEESVKFNAQLFENRLENLKRIDSMLDMVGLLKHKHKKISECSKGMARRAALAQTMIHDPDLVILDEPTSGFDPVGISEVRDMIKDFKKNKKTVILCSHQLANVEGVCDEILILNRGKVLKQGRLDELLNSNLGGHLLLKNAESNKDILNWLTLQNIKFQVLPEQRLDEYFVEAIKKCSFE